MLAGNEREALLRVARRLSVELGYTDGEETPCADSTLREVGVMAGILDSEDELLVDTVRQDLAKVAAALDGTGRSKSAVGATLDGVEMVMRGELVSGNGRQLLGLMPSFVFLVALTVVDQDRALRLARRTEEILKPTSTP